MHVVEDLQSTHPISNPAIRELVQQRINDLGGESFDSNELGYFLVVESSDTLEALSAQLGFDMLRNRFTGIRFNATGFTPSFEFIEEFPACYDMVFVLDDTGIGIELFVPKEEGIAHFSDRGHLFQADRGRRFRAIVDAQGMRASEGLNVSQSSKRSQATHREAACWIATSQTYPRRRAALATYRPTRWVSRLGH